jgi:hypothetical protein
MTTRGTFPDAHFFNMTVNGDVTHTSGTASKPVFTLVNTNADANSTELKFNKNSASPADDDSLGKINFYGDDSAGTSTEFVKIEANSTDVTDADEAGELTFTLFTGGLNGTAAATEILRLGGEDTANSVRGGIFTKSGNSAVAVGAGMSEATITTNVSEINGIVETLIYIDIGGGTIDLTDGDTFVIGETDAANSHLTQVSPSVKSMVPPPISIYISVSTIPFISETFVVIVASLIPAPTATALFPLFVNIPPRTEFAVSSPPSLKISVAAAVPLSPPVNKVNVNSPASSASVTSVEFASILTNSVDVPAESSP